MRDFTRFFSRVLLLLILVTSGSYVAAQGCTTPPANMVGWWPGDGKATDIAGPNDGKLVNGVTFTTGYVGQAFHLNGWSQYVDVENAPRLDVSAGDFTADAWVYFNAVGDKDQLMINKMNDAEGLNYDGWTLRYWGTWGTYQFMFCLGAPGNGCAPGVPTTVVSTSSVAAGTWYFVAGVKTSTQISIYVNGNLENTTSLGPFTDTNSADLQIGGISPQDGGETYLNGLVDEVELFNRALSSEEIAAIYNAAHSGKCKVLVCLPSKLTFAPQSVGTTSPPKSLTLKNESPNGGVLNIASISTTGNFSQTNNCSRSMDPGQECVIQVTFTPTGMRTRTGTLSVTYNSPNGLPRQVQLTGASDMRW